NLEIFIRMKCFLPMSASLSVPEWIFVEAFAPIISTVFNILRLYDPLSSICYGLQIRPNGIQTASR
ncbi:MAG: hypothetical protein KDD06_19530, partial [Phaeodactylibacter sp.]|nr:hypothetical protein [Phaeodactylibacter sp.]